MGDAEIKILRKRAQNARALLGFNAKTPTGLRAWKISALTVVAGPERAKIVAAKGRELFVGDELSRRNQEEMDRW